MRGLTLFNEEDDLSKQFDARSQIAKHQDVNLGKYKLIKGITILILI